MFLGQIARSALRTQAHGSPLAINLALKSISSTASRGFGTVASRHDFSTQRQTSSVASALQQGQAVRLYSSASSDLTHATALVYSAYGRPTEVLKVLEHTLPNPGNDEVQVQFMASPINPADINQVEGVYPLKPPMTTQLYNNSSDQTKTPVAVGGNEGVAKVTKVGPNSTSSLKVGDWVVMGSAGLGTWRSHGNFLAKDLTKVRPLSASGTGLNETDQIIQLATLTVNPCTAYRMLRDFKTLSPGDFIIQNGANSGVGEAVIQLAKAMDVKTINIIRKREGSDQVAECLQKLGATYILTDDQLGRLETKELVKSWTAPSGSNSKGSKIKLGFNCVGGKPATEMARLLSADGHLITYGAMSRQPLILPASLQIFKNVHASGFWLTAWNDRHSAQERQEMVDAVLNDMDRGILKGIHSSKNTWSLKSSESLQDQLLEAVQKATSSGHGKQVFVMQNC